MKAKGAAFYRPEIVIRHSDEEQCLAWYGNVQILLSRQPPSADFMRTLISELDDLSRECGAGTGALLVIRSDVAPPSDEAREYIKRELSRSSMLAAAQVVEGTGFRGAAIRSVLTMLQLAVRPPYAMKIFDSVRRGAEWLTRELTERAGVAPLSQHLADATSDLRTRFLHGSLNPSSSRYAVAPRVR